MGIDYATLVSAFGSNILSLAPVALEDPSLSGHLTAHL